MSEHRSELRRNINDPKCLTMADMKSFIWTWIVGFFVIIALLATMTGMAGGGWRGYLTLVQSGATTRALVIKTDRTNHCRAEYSFRIGGGDYNGRGADCDARVGAMVNVTYLISNPAISCLGAASDNLWNELMAFIGAGIVFPPFLYFAIRRRWKR
jgi:hypothetical protein